MTNIAILWKSVGLSSALENAVQAKFPAKNPNVCVLLFVTVCDTEEFLPTTFSAHL